MFYIFNSDHICIAHCDAVPNEEDLATRGEYSIECDGECKIGYIHNDGVVSAPVAPKLTEDEIAAQARAKRDACLSKFDTNLYRNQFYWGVLTQAQRDERLAYRQALLDLPEQKGFPTEIVWPVYPSDGVVE